jgi:predicted transcriptional regulator
MDILRAIMEGALQSTEIMYRTNLAWFPLLENLSSLDIEGFVSKETTWNSRIYSVTEKGIEMVRDHLRQIREMRPSPSLLGVTPLSVG